MIGLALTPSSWGAAISRRRYLSESNQFFGRLVTPPTEARKALYNRLIASLMSAGVWSKLDALYLFAAADAPTALTNLVQSAFAGTASGSPTFTADQGYTGASAKYIDSGYNASTGGGKFSQNSASVFAWGNKSAQDGGGLVGYAGGNAGIQLYGRFTDDLAYCRVNAGANLTVASLDGSGFWCGSRVSSALTTLYKNGVSIGTTTTASAAPASQNIAFMRQNANYYTGLEYCGGFGSGLTDADALALYNALHVYLQAVAAVA